MRASAAVPVIAVCVATMPHRRPQARRAAFNTSKSGEGNFLGDKELVDAVASGRVELDAIATEQLPAPLQALPPGERKALIEDKAQRRSVLKQEMQALAQERAIYLRDRVEEAGGADASLDHGIYRAVREQAAEAGLDYGADAPAY